MQASVLRTTGQEKCLVIRVALNRFSTAANCGTPLEARKEDTALSCRFASSSLAPVADVGTYAACLLLRRGKMRQAGAIPLG